MGTAKSVEPWQITKMWAIARALGMDKDDLHAMAGVESLKALSSTGANDVLTRMQRLQGAYTPAKKASTAPAKAHSEVPGMITDGQQRKVWRQMYELAELDAAASSATLGDRLCGIIKKELHIDATAKQPFLWMTFKQGGQLIDLLKRYIASARKKRGDASGTA